MREWKRLVGLVLGGVLGVSKREEFLFFGFEAGDAFLCFFYELVMSVFACMDGWDGI